NHVVDEFKFLINVALESCYVAMFFFFFQAEDGIRDLYVTGVQTCALPISIEEGMLGVLKFKKSLFAGVLDGGEKDVFLGGSRLNKFMETVEAATAAIPEEMIEDAEEAMHLPPLENGPEPSGDGRKTGGERW